MPCSVEAFWHSGRSTAAKAFGTGFITATLRTASTGCISALVEALEHGAHGPEFVSLLYLHYALRDRLTYDFVTEVLWHKGYQSRPLVSRNEVLDLLDAKAPEHPEIERWTETSRVKLAGNMLSALRDFRVLEGIQKKFLVRPGLPLRPRTTCCGS